MKWVVGLVAAVAVLGVIAATAITEARHAEVKRVQAEQAGIQRVADDAARRMASLQRVERLGREDLDRKFMEFDSIFERAGRPDLKLKPLSKRYQEERLEERRLELEERRLELAERREKRIAEEAE